jgi:hypothetical protein
VAWRFEDGGWGIIPLPPNTADPIPNSLYPQPTNIPQQITSASPTRRLRTIFHAETSWSGLWIVCCTILCCISPRPAWTTRDGEGRCGCECRWCWTGCFGQGDERGKLAFSAAFAWRWVRRASTQFMFRTEFFISDLGLELDLGRGGKGLVGWLVWLVGWFGWLAIWLFNGY